MYTTTQFSAHFVYISNNFSAPQPTSINYVYHFTTSKYTTCIPLLISAHTTCTTHLILAYSLCTPQLIRAYTSSTSQLISVYLTPHPSSARTTCTPHLISAYTTCTLQLMHVNIYYMYMYRTNQLTVSFRNRVSLVANLHYPPAYLAERYMYVLYKIC